MGDDAEQFRERARECRDVAAQANDEEWRRTLLTLAQDLEDEADKIDAEKPD